MDGKDYMNLSPLHKRNLRRRLQAAVDLRHHITKTMGLFRKYASMGQEMCKILGQLSGAFQDFKEFQTDPTFSRITETLVSVRESFTRHYDAVEETVVMPLDNFVQSMIIPAEKKGKEADKEYEEYTKLVDQYMSPQNKKSPETALPMQYMLRCLRCSRHCLPYRSSGRPSTIPCLSPTPANSLSWFPHSEGKRWPKSCRSSYVL